MVRWSAGLTCQAAWENDGCGLLSYDLRWLVKKVSEFTAAVAYALFCLQQEYIALKDKQLEELYRSNDIFTWFWWAMASPSATNSCRFGLITNLSIPVLPQSIVIISSLVLLMVGRQVQNRHVAVGILSDNKGVDKKLLTSMRHLWRQLPVALQCSGGHSGQWAVERAFNPPSLVQICGGSGSGWGTLHVQMVSIHKSFCKTASITT